jgi:hypothetical protein
MDEPKITERAAKMTIILGANGTGKSTLLHDIITHGNEKSLVITPDDSEWRKYAEVELLEKDDFVFSGVRRHIFDPQKKCGTLDKIHMFKKGKLIFDDCRAYLLSATDLRIRQLLIRRRQRMVDVFAVGHGFTEVPPVFFTFATDIILFRTTDNIFKRKDCLKDFEKMLEAQKRVNAMAAKNPHYYEVIKIS